MDEQRKRVYGYRQKILDGVNCRDLITQMIDEQIGRIAARPFLDSDYGVIRYAAAAAGCSTYSSSPRLPQSTASTMRERIARDEASRQAESQILDAIEENLPEEEEEAGVELDGAGQVVQHPLEHQLPRSRTEEDRPRSSCRRAHQACSQSR